ncbi:hypothetical protein IB685_01530 [Francisella tularensis subsp. novicida FSC159]|uniref:hypothetical protein n=1 Tax=Francisella tularensis TaxID=263 RepID=UPI001C0F02A6|nr:hypothetical protein [Francisella tularensis]MBK2110861.1 hypothetical protein [Francisella tularensis subsp. novicida FSC159]
MKKLLLATILAIPAMGYCGLIDWLTGYPEVKAKIEKRLEEKYQGDKFEVWDVSYSSNLGGYNFKAKDLSYKYLESGGSYYEKSNKVVDNFGNAKQAMDWKALFRSYVDAVSTNNVIRASIDGANPVDGEHQKPISEMRKTLAVLFNNSIPMKEKIKQRHDYIRVYNTIYVDAPKSPQGMLKVLEMIENINNYFRSLHLYSYELEVAVYDLPKGLTFDKYIDEAVDKNIDYNWSDFENDGDIQKYAWGWLRIYGCEKNSIEKYCKTYFGIKDEQKRQNAIFRYSTADRIHSLADIAREFHLFKNYGKPTVPYWRKQDNPDDLVWIAVRREYIPLIDTQLYKQVLQLENK